MLTEIQKARKAYYKANKKKIDVKSRAYDLANKEKVAAKNKAYYEANKEANKEKESIRKKVYLAAKRKETGFIEKVAAKNKAYYEANKEANKEKYSITAKKWYLNNKDKVEANIAKRRALLINAESIMTEAEKENYKALVKIRDDATKLFGYAWSIEHIIPLTKGGTNAIDNLEVTPLSWNKAKGNRSSESFWG